MCACVCVGVCVCVCVRVWVCVGVDDATMCILCLVSLQSIWCGGTCGCSLPRKEVRYLQHDSVMVGEGGVG